MIGGGRNPTDVAGEREGRGSRYWEVRGERRKADGFSVCWDRDGGRPGVRMILWWRWQRKAKDDGGGGGISDVRKRGWGGSNKEDTQQ